MKKVVIVCGLIAGVLISAFMGYSMVLCYNNPDAHGLSSMLVGFAAMFLAFSLVFVGIKNFRDKYNDGVISFGKAFQIGFLISLIASTMYVITWYIEYHYFIPDFMDFYAASQIKQAQEGGASAAKIAELSKEMAEAKESYKNPIKFIGYTYAEILPVGIIVSLISALILKRKPNGNRVAAHA
ncbi:MAG: DUF4199 domain-containing protein [Sphingobacteriales bacterium]|nr:MAG: DUF4199 domain-containing protein [Sphingobacteriales bacterium]